MKLKLLPFLLILFFTITCNYTFSQDADLDSVIDNLDVDDDNDGILDVDEASQTTTGSFAWTHNTTGSNIDLDYMNPNIAGWFLSSSSNEFSFQV